MKSFDPNIDFEDASTWDLQRLPLTNKLNMYEHYSVVYERFMWDARMEPGVIEAFAKNWGTDELLVSFDNLTVILPNLRPVRAPWPHVDQAPRKRGMHCVQGIINLSHAGPDDGSLTAIPGSHRLVEEFFETQTNPATWEFKDYRYFSKDDMA
jgi:hypothetical protein